MNLWSFDTEDDSKGNVYMVNFYDGETHYTFHRDTDPKFAENALQFLAQIDNAEIWSCNLQYDIVNTFKSEISLLKMTFIGSRIITATWEGLTFKDTLNHWKISVKGMGEKINLEKLDAGRDFNNPKYCQRDTEIVWRFVSEMRKRYDLFGAKLKPTIGSTSLDLFESRYFKKVRKNPFSTLELNFLKSGYYGGRTEIFHNRMCEGKIYYSDFNSLYPSCMSGHFPVLYEKNLRKIKSKSRKVYERGLVGTVECTVVVPENHWLPYLPYRDPKTGRLLFPVGEFRGVWTSFELREAEKLGVRIKRIHRGFYFDTSSQTIFNTFVSDLYGRRLEAKSKRDELLADAYKLILNNLYGKFAQGREITKIIPFKEKRQLKAGDLLIGDLILRNEISKKYPSHTNFIWSALVTAYGRHKLWLAMSEVLAKGGQLIYCDTDSIIYRHDKPLFKESEELGGLKLEGIFKRAWFKLPKMYFLEEFDGKSTFKTKGVPKLKAQEYFETGKTSFQKPYKLKESLRRSVSKNPRKKIQANVWDTIEKTTKQVYDKRLVNKNGSTEPINLGGEN